MSNERNRMRYFVGDEKGNRFNKRTFKTLKGAAKHRFDLCDEGSGKKLCRENAAGEVEVYCGTFESKQEWLLVKTPRMA